MRSISGIPWYTHVLENIVGGVQGMPEAPSVGWDLDPRHGHLVQRWWRTHALAALQLLMNVLKESSANSVVGQGMSFVLYCHTYLVHMPQTPELAFARFHWDFIPNPSQSAFTACAHKLSIWTYNQPTNLLPRALGAYCSITLLHGGCDY